jgi:XRE family transcriptional regulator, regulator of sulfur utilization
MDVKQLLGRRIKEIRQQNNITQEDLAEMAGISAKYLSSIERGKENFTLNTIINIAQALKIELNEIFIQLHFEDFEFRKQRLISLIDDADEENLKIIEKICNIIIRKTAG